MAVEDAHPGVLIRHGGIVEHLGVLALPHLGRQHRVDEGADVAPESLELGVKTQFHRACSCCFSHSSALAMTFVDEARKPTGGTIVNTMELQLPVR